jgi:hypothetical protein
MSGLDDLIPHRRPFLLVDRVLECEPGKRIVIEGVAEDGTRTVIADGLTFPTSLRFGPDGALYVSNRGFGVPLGTGEILRISLQ